MVLSSPKIAINLPRTNIVKENHIGSAVSEIFRFTQTHIFYTRIMGFVINITGSLNLKVSIKSLSTSVRGTTRSASARRPGGDRFESRLNTES